MEGTVVKAAQIKEYGDISAINIEEVDKPTAGEGQVLIEVKAASLNPFDSAIRAGYMKEMIPLELPVTLGGDIAGVVAEVGEGVTAFQTGDKVYGQANVVTGASGAFAQFSVTSANQIAKMPSSLEFNDAASLPLVGSSAIQALNEHIKLEEGQKILIIGGSGGIGAVAIAIAKNIGAHVVTTVPTDGVSYAKELGADEVIDYKTQSIPEDSEFDAVFDTAGGEAFDTSLKFIKKGGIMVTMAAQPDEDKAKELGIQVIGQMTQITSTVLDTLSKHIDSGVVKSRIAKTFSLDQVQDAFKAREEESHIGKILLSVNQ